MDLSLRTRLPHEETEIAKFLSHLEATVRQSLSWNPSVTHASMTAIGPDQRAYTAYAKRETSTDMSVWIREAGAVEPEEWERDRTVVAQEKMLGDVRPKRVPKADPRIWK